MPTHIKAFVVVIVIAILCFAFIAKPAKKIISPADFHRWRILWLAVTSTAFLIGNFWALLFATTLFVLFAQKEATKPALYWLLICVIPPNAHEIPGFGIINQLFPIDMPRLLALIVLLPALMLASKRNRKSVAVLNGPDILLVLFFLVSTVFAFRGQDVTVGLRSVVLLFLGIWIPYFAFSRQFFNRITTCQNVDDYEDDSSNPGPS